MQRLLHIGTGSEPVRELDPEALDDARRLPGWVWLDVVGEEEAGIVDICRRFGFDGLAVEDVLSPTKHPRLDGYPDYTFVVLHGIADDETEFRTVESDIFVGSGYLVIFRSEELPGYVWARDHLLAGGQVPLGPDLLFAMQTEVGAERFGVLVDALADQTEGLEERAVVGDPTVIGEVHALRRDAARLRRVLVPQRDAMRRLAGDTLAGIDGRARMRLGSAMDHYERSLESLDASRSMLGAVLDTYRAAVAERANEVMKVLTVFAAIMLPLSLIAGVYGMNFTNMPELAWRWAYFAALGLMATVAVGLWVYFSRRGFIGGPKLSTIPRAVGRGLGGLIRLTTLPVGYVGRVVNRRDRRS